MEIIVKSRMLFLAVDIIVIGFNLAGEPADRNLISRFF